MLWLHLFVITWSFSRSLAQNNNGSSCHDASLPGQVDGRKISVPELCLSVQETATPLSRALNFTLAENGSLVLEPLPPARQVSVDVEEKSDGLKPWANLANSFVDSVRTGSLPYGIIIYCTEMLVFSMCI